MVGADGWMGDEMKRIHVPVVDGRYWAAILLASVFGTNLGDYYAHESGLGIGRGLLVLAAVVLVAFVLERLDGWRHEVWYWLVILVIRTGATNIADWLAFRVKIPPVLLVSGLVALLCLFGWGTHWARRGAVEGAVGLPRTGAAYWLAMLTAGVFGTVVGDICSHAIGQGMTSIVLGVLFAVVLVVGRGRAATVMAVYWATVAVARTAGTAMGDWLAENDVLKIGLARSTVITGVAFVGLLVIWRGRREEGSEAV